MKKTKQRILDQSKNLFNENSFSQVTIRMIASALKMSSGNLNYHFRKREEILEALYFEMVAVFDQRVQGLEVQELSLERMQKDIQVSMQRMVDYRFFWTDLYYLLKVNEKIKVHFEMAKTARIKGYQYVFQLFIEQNLMDKPPFPKAYEFLIERMINYSNTWLYASALYDIDQSTDLIENASFQLMSMLYPYLTDSGKVAFRNLFPLHFK